jgi:hypothetical protein
MESKYQNGKIYKIVCNESGKIYIGSTTQSLNTRLIHHKSDYKRYLQGKTNYFTSYQILENNNYHIELICDYPCSCKKELQTMEAKYIREIDCVNKYIPCRTKKEYGKQRYEQNKDKTKEYREQNKDKKKEYDKQYYEQNREKIKEYKKQYKEQNKEKIKEYKKQYREQNKDKIREHNKQYYERMKQNKITI